MAPGPKVLLVLGVSSLGLAAAASFTRARPIPRQATSVELGESTPGGVHWNLRAVIPRRVLAGQSAPIRLELSAVESPSEVGGDLFVASVAAPGGAVSPAADQLAPAGYELAFAWLVEAHSPGQVEVTPSLAIRDSATGDQVLWARSYDMDVWTVAGLDASGLTVVAVVAGGLGVLFVASWMKERTKWIDPRADSQSSR